MSAPRVLGTTALAMITMAAVVNLRNLSFLAELGFTAVFFLIIAAAIFFIPIALVTAELASSWPRPGGCYVWVDEAFGKRLAFVTIWLSWMASVTWFPTILAFTATMLAHMLHPIFPDLASNVFFIFITMLVIFWITTIINFLGIQFSSFFISLGVTVGTLIPGFLIIALGLWWIVTAQPSHTALTVNALMPDFKLDNLILFSAVLLSLGGVELAAYHIREAKNPQKSYPRAVLFAVIMILAVYIFGTIGIVVVVPQTDLTLASGLIQAFNVFFANFGMSWTVPFIALFLFIGAIAGLNSYVLGPAKGLLVVAEDGFFPRWLQYVNKHEVPTSLLMTQALVGSVMSGLFLYINDVNASLWLFTAISTQFTVIQYLFVFCAAVKLRKSQPGVKRAFKVPAINLCATLGIVACIFSCFIIYAEHGKLVMSSHEEYCLLLVASLILLMVPAALLMLYRNRSNTAK